LNSKRSDLLWKNLDARAKDYCRTSVIFKYSAAFLQEKNRIPADLKKWSVLPHLSIPGNSRMSFAKWLTFLNRTEILTGRIIGDITLFRQASLSWLLVFALRLKYKKIIFCGVDLNSPNYFYDIREPGSFFNTLFVPPPEFNSKIHPTNSLSQCHGNITISNVINIFNKEICSMNEIQLFTASEKSALYPMLPLYLW
jgi:hypothetical protein